MNFNFEIFNVLMIISVVMIMSVFVFILVRAAVINARNNNSPQLSVWAVIVTKRTEAHHHSTSNTGFHSTTTNWHYVTFEVESGDLMEFQIDSADYGLMAEGDKGKLTFQGTRFISFERER